jgi:acetyltransferase-like isoleucine patch superfamily enzyme
MICINNIKLFKKLSNSFKYKTHSPCPYIISEVKNSFNFNCDIASFVTINCADSHLKTIGKLDYLQRADIHIENNVFIGSHSIILGNVKIGRNSVIGAGSLVKNINIPEYSLAYGNPLIVKKGYYL